MNSHVIFRLVNENDLRSIEECIETASAEIVRHIPKLATGVCYATGVAVPMAMMVKVPLFE